MKNLWNDGEAEKLVEHYAAKGVGRDLALRVYTTRLLGGDPRLVLHGGGNTSVQDQGDRPRRRRMGCALRQGQRLGHGRHRAAGPAGGEARRAAQGAQAATSFPTRTWWRCSAPTSSTRPRPTRRWRRCCTPSCRTNSSTTRIRPPSLAWSTRRTARRSARKVFGKTFGFVPYIMPGFDLAKAAARSLRAGSRPSIGLILDKHGIFTFGDDAQAGL